MTSSRKICLFIGGLPASGKTTYALKLMQRYDAFFIDDPRNVDDLEGVFDYDFVIIADPYFSHTSVRKFAANRVVSEGYDVYTIMIDTPFKQCKNNAKERLKTQPNKHVIKLLERLNGGYSNENADLVITDINDPKFDEVEKLICRNKC